MPYQATSDNVSLYYEDHGSGKPIVFIHGWTCNRHFFEDQVEALRDEYRVISFDLRGHGDSETPENGLTMERMARDVHELIESLDLAPVSLVGWSMGMHIICDYVDQFGCDALDRVVFLDMSPKIVTDEEWDLGLYGEFGYADSQELLEVFTVGWDRVAADVVPDLFDTISGEELEWIIDQSKKTKTRVVVNMWVAMIAQDYRDMLSDITVPTLVTYGEESSLYLDETAEYLADQIPDTQVVGFPDVGHGISLGMPERLTQELEEFL